MCDKYTKFCSDFNVRFAQICLHFSDLKLKNKEPKGQF